MPQFKANIAPANSGVVTSIRGSVVDMRFDALTTI